MIWIDIDTPKYALFFAYLIPLLKKQGHELFVTTRCSEGYTETKDLVELYGVRAHVLGEYGGQTREGKLKARLRRQQECVELFEKQGVPEALICGSVVDSIQTAFGLGIPVINFCDTPIAGCEFSHDLVTVVSKLTLSLSRLVFHPFIIPKEIYPLMGVDPQKICTYDFIDVILWMKDLEAKTENDFRLKENIDTSKPTILIREEEYKAHYVKNKLPIIYEAIPKLAEELNANLVVMPRYESDYLEKEFGDKVHVVKKKYFPHEFYPFIDLLIGGGGTMNLESCCAGIPTISTRSLWLYHDKYLIDNGMMKWTDNVNDVVSWSKELIGKRFDHQKLFYQTMPTLDEVANHIHEFLESEKNS